MSVERDRFITELLLIDDFFSFLWAGIWICCSCCYARLKDVKGVNLVCVFGNPDSTGSCKAKEKDVSIMLCKKNTIDDAFARIRRIEWQLVQGCNSVGNDVKRGSNNRSYCALAVT